ncbi:MAG: alpha/beta hydrolase family protein [Myxococcota bacterium]
MYAEEVPAPVQVEAPPAPPPREEPVLAEARRGFRTAVSVVSAAPLPLPDPPAELFVRTDYTSPQGLVLPAFVSPDPGEGRRHPAIVWLTGGDTNSLDDFWTPGPEANDQSVHAFRQAGVVIAFPTLRGGNTNGGGKEYFLGEVDDVLAAAEHVAALP